jgi:hypothetical protein
VPKDARSRFAFSRWLHRARNQETMASPQPILLGAVAVAIALLIDGSPAAPQAQPGISPPVLTAPTDDPGHTHCFMPSRSKGVILDWKLTEQRTGAGLPLASYLDVRRRTRGTRAWRPWIKRYARPPFTLVTRSSTYDSEFAWHVWAVDRSGRSRPYAVSSDWHLFCTLPAAEPPAYGSSTPGHD